MGLFRKTLLAGATVLAASALTGVAAQANPIYVGYSLNGGMTITTVSAAEGFNSFSVTAGGFTVSGTGTGAPITSQGMLLSNSTSVSATTAGNINIYISETGNTLPAMSFTTGFGNNSSSTNSVMETSYVTAGNVAFGGQYKLSSTTVAPGAPDSSVTALAPTGLGTPYTLTSVYSISYGANGGFTTSTLNVQANTATAVPEPASLALLGAGLVGVGAIRRRRAK